MPTMVSRSDYIDPVARHIRTVYEEFTSRWAREQQRRQEGQNSERAVGTSSSSAPAPSEAETKRTADFPSPNEHVVSSPVDASVQQNVEAPVVVRRDQRRSAIIDLLNSSDESGSPIVSTRGARRPTDQHSKKPKSQPTNQATLEKEVEHEHEPEDGYEHHTELVSPNGRGRRSSAQPHHYRKTPSPSATLSKDDRETATTRGSRLREHQSKLHDEPTQRQQRYAERQQRMTENATSLRAENQQSESDEDVINSKRRRARSSGGQASKRLRGSPAEAITKLTITTRETEAEHEARLKHKREREAEERSIVERHAAEQRANEVEIRKCYYCWHYSQPCNPKLKPKCIPCHKNRRSCFGSYTRREFCQTYEERTGKIHKLTKKDVVNHRPQIQRKGHYNRPRTSSSASGSQPQRFFLNANQLKCYRCWDRNLSCDLNTPKCGSCEKSRSACFGFKSNRQEFCEMFEEETGVKHRWAAVFEGGDLQSSPQRSGASSRKKARVIAHEDESSEPSEEDGWDSEDEESSEDDIDDTDDSE